MAISVGLKEENSDGVVWLFPIPANPNDITIDVLASLPSFGGEEISAKAKLNLDEITKFLHLTQLYTRPLVEPPGARDRFMSLKAEWIATI